MGLSKKRKQQLKKLTNRSLKTCKLQKLDQENYRRKVILRRQRDNEDFWDEYEVDSSSDKSSLDASSSNKEKLMIEGDKRDKIWEGLEDNDKRISLEPEEQNFKPT